MNTQSNHSVIELLKNTPNNSMSVQQAEQHLTDMVDSTLAQNTAQVAATAIVEAVRQQVGFTHAGYLIQAYNWFAAKVAQGEPITVDVIAQLTGIIEPDTHGRFRTFPVTFADGGTAAHHSIIHDALNTLFEYGDELSPEEFTKEYLWIHPSFDGNGRTAWLIYNWKNDSLPEPSALPKFF